MVTGAQRVRSSRFPFVAICAMAVVSGVLSRHVVLDDGAIVERYITQILAGHGWVWNPGERRNALTSFAHPVSVLAVAEVVRDVGLATHIVGTVTLAAAGLAAWRLLARVGTPAGGVIAGMAVTVFPPLTHTWGLETAMYVACLVALPLVQGKRLGALAALTFLTRPDGIIAAGIALGRGVLTRGRNKVAMVALFTVPVAAWLLWERWLFHAWLPASVGVKADQGAYATGGFAYTSGWRREIVDVCGGAVPAVLVLAVVALGLVLAVVRRARPILEVTSVVVIQQAAFALTPVPSYRWYYVPLLVVGLLLACYAADAGVTALLPVIRLSRLRGGAIAALAVALLLVFVSRVPRTDDPRESEFAQIAASMPHMGTATVAASEVGELGAALPAQTRVLDISGLTTAPVLADRRWRSGFWRDDPRAVVFHWFPGRLRRDATTDVAARYERESGLRVDGARQRRGVDGLPPGAPFSSESVFLSDPRFYSRYELRRVVSRRGYYASLLLFTQRHRSSAS